MDPLSDGVLSEGWRSRLLKRLGLPVLLCFRCGKEIPVGSSIHINHGYGKGVELRVPRIYHADCYAAMFFD
jgi:hypothetical protein